MDYIEFEYLIANEFVNGVLKPFSPNLIYRRQLGGQYYPRFEVGVIVEHCKFLFVWEEGGGVMIAPLSSRFENTNDGWFSLGRILCFITHQPFTWESPYQNIPHDHQIVQTMKSARMTLAPYVSQVISLFSSDKKLADWIFDYEKYEDEQFRLKYPALYESYRQRKQKSKQKKQ